MTRIDVEDMALLEDEISQLRSENEYLKIAIDAANHENEQLRTGEIIPDGWHIEHRHGDDGAASWPGGVLRPSTLYKRVVGPWQVVNQSAVAAKLLA